MRKGILYLTVRPDFTISEAMKRITHAGRLGLPSGIAAVVDNRMRLLGIVTDGDIRRAIVDNTSLNEKISVIMNRNPVVFLSDSSYEDILRKISSISVENLNKNFIHKVILINKSGQLEDILDFYYIWQFQNIKTLRIAVIGMGYVGLPLSIIFAESGFATYGIEEDRKLIKNLKRGIPHFYEKGLKPLLQDHLKTGLLKLVDTLDDIRPDAYVICVGVPFDRRTKKPNFSALSKAAKAIGKKLKTNDLVILRSTVPVQTTRDYLLPLLEKESGLEGGKQFLMAFAPERAIEGRTIEEIRRLPQVIGGLNNRSLEKAVSLFRIVCDNVITVDSLEEAELVKLINNSYRDFIFSFSNEFALLCEHLNIDAAKCIKAASNGYPRGNIPIPSPGVGGMCLTKDPYFYAYSLDRLSFVSKGALHSRKINEYMPIYFANKIISVLKEMNKDISETKIFVIGFAFKGLPETSDTRDSATLVLVKILKDKVRTIAGYDPLVKREEMREYGVSPSSITQGFKDADAVIIMNNNPAYSEIEISKCIAMMKKPSLFCDFWGIFSAEGINKLGEINYMGLGFIKRFDDGKRNK